MKKISNVMIVLAGMLLAGCSTTKEGVSVGNISNTECAMTRSGEPVVQIDNPTLKLTKDGDVITGFLKNFEINCSDKNLVVKCRQEGSVLQIDVHDQSYYEHQGSGDIARTNCFCRVNVYFTLYDIEGDRFLVNLNKEKLGEISFAEHSVVEIDRITLQQAYEGGFDFTETFNEESFHFLEYKPDDEDPIFRNPTLHLSYGDNSHSIIGHYYYFAMPCDYQKFGMVMDTEPDGTIVFRIDTDGKYSPECENRADIVFRMINAQKESYHIKVNPHTVTVKDAEGTEHEETVCDFDGELKKGSEISVPLAERNSSKDDEDEDQELTPRGYIADVVGLLSYDEDLQAWHFISRWPYVPVGPEFDLYPIELADDFKVDGLVVNISGNVYMGIQRAYIDITDIKVDSKWPAVDKNGFFPMDTEECFSAQVTDAKYDGDSIKAVITENPAWDSYAFFAPHEGSSVLLLKSDLQNPDIHEGDVIDFRIVRYKMLSIIYNGPETYCHEFFCSVKPCK